MANKIKTHKATAKRFTSTASGKMRHSSQGYGNGHSKAYQNRRQKKSKRQQLILDSSKEARKISRLLQN